MPSTTTTARDALAAARSAEHDARQLLAQREVDADAGRDLEPLALATAREGVDLAVRKVATLTAAADAEHHAEQHAAWTEQLATAEAQHADAERAVNAALDALGSALTALISAHRQHGATLAVRQDLRHSEPRTREQLEQQGHELRPAFHAPALDVMVAGEVANALRAAGLERSAVVQELTSTGSAW